MSDKYKHFCEQNGIRRKLVAPYHPSSNGEVDRFVQTYKAANVQGRKKGTSASSCTISVSGQISNRHTDQVKKRVRKGNNSGDMWFYVSFN